MTFAKRWKHENLRLVLLSAVISIAMTVMLLVLLYGTADKSISLVVDGEENVVTTKQWVMQRLLDEQSIAIGEHDELSTPLNASVKDGDRIVINHAKEVTVEADGVQKSIHTTARTVQAALAQLNIELDGLDKVQPALSEPLTNAMTVSVTRVDKEIRRTEHEMPYKVVKKEDPLLEKGKEKIMQTGKEGLIVKEFEKIYEDGALVSQRLMTKTVEQQTVEQIVAIGTKLPEREVAVLSAPSKSEDAVTVSGETLNAKKVLNNVTLTAYTAGIESTGKTEDHPQYGITASGTTVQEGRTIAVDPDVIPLGWWVYIEGIGYRRAEDTGSAINGNKIDVFYESKSYALKFGRKKGFTVYVLGPNKPKSS
ncbi:DUF348 domain-containing protein [Paenibacillus sp. IB182496]|uniref:DUF348 domain-containing protein n=2 Tax=Paenibacillus sabuli TaxID=2772509 RepID=A0A927GTX6_9BACL|nr:3D domain-containing protein [Paenibacillus sabuli]MBD2848324.1 DUF348 domain-containing protein [Paenibacillus sabuli]